MLLRTSVNILAFDAYGYAEHLALYPEALRVFLARGGMLAWGLVPNTAQRPEAITLAGAWQTLERATDLLRAQGVQPDGLLPRARLSTPTCAQDQLARTVG